MTDSSSRQFTVTLDVAELRVLALRGITTPAQINAWIIATLEEGLR